MGAVESNAGDDFHFWWAASRALALIGPGGEGRLLTIEGLSSVDDPDDAYEAVDVAVYFGGDDVPRASAVVVSQLKYSSRHPEQAWTVGRVCKRRTVRGADGRVLSSRSVISDLAGIYGGLASVASRGELRGKLRICLVGNQLGDPVLLEGVAAAASWVRSRGGETRKASLLQGLGGAHRQVVERLAAAVGDRLKSSEFCDFLAILDLAQLGTLGRAAIARSVRAGTAELTPRRGSDSALRLFDLVRREALPDRSRGGIRAADVLAELGVADLSDLYPAPARLPVVADLLPAPGGRTVAEAVLAHPGGVIVAHGGFGAGKTTALQQLDAFLPPGSVVVLFDCYGGGEYLSSGEERHTPQRFVTQVVNDLAQRCGTSLLVEPPPFPEELWRRLSRTLTNAVAVLPVDAMLVLAVDAADNAAFAADKAVHTGFLPSLLRLGLPPQVAVVLTARTNRVASLGAAGATMVELAVFDPPTSATHLRRQFPDASEVESLEFHTRTGGNPRVQFYLLAQGASDGWDIATLLAESVATPEPLFAKIVESALQVTGADSGGRRWLAAMVALSRPIATTVFAAALDVDVADVVAFARGLQPGVELTDGRIQFRDENFETYVREVVDPADERRAHDRLADIFLARRATDGDAAAHVADHLYAAGRLDDLVHVVLEENPGAIPDGFRRAEVQGRRLDLVARVAADTDAAASVAVRLAVLGCENASRLDTLSALLDSHLDIAARYADVDLVRAHALRQHDDDRWLAPILMRLAAVFSRDPSGHPSAREALDASDAWLRRWISGHNDETWGWHVDFEDVASAAEARFRLDGVDAAITELRRWRPAEFAFDATAALAERVAGQLGPERARDILYEHRVPLLVHGPFLACAATPATPPDGDWLTDVVAAVLESKPGQTKPWKHRLIAIAARHGDPVAASALALHWVAELPDHRWGFASSKSDGLAMLRSRALAAVLQATALTVEELLPQHLKDDRGGQERSEWTRTVEPLLAAALVAARAATTRIEPNEVGDFIAAGLAQRTAAARHRWFSVDNTYRAWAAMAADAAADVRAAPELIDRIADAAPVLLRRGAPGLWLDMAAALISHPAHRDRAVDLCMRAARHAVTDSYPAPDRLEFLARAATIAGDLDPVLGKQFFDRMVRAAGGVNDEAARLLSVHADLARRADIAGPERSSIAASLVQAAEEVAAYVTEAAVVPYAAVVGAAAQLDATVGLAAASRWDDEDRIGLASTLGDALLGAVDGGGVSVSEALWLDHLVDHDRARLRYRLAILERLPPGATRAATIRRALAPTVAWLRCNVAAAVQPALAQLLLAWLDDAGVDGLFRAELQTIAAFAADDDGPRQRGRSGDLPPQAQILLDSPHTRTWRTLADDIAVLADAYVFGAEMRGFIGSVIGAAAPAERIETLAAVADLTGVRGADTATALAVLAQGVRAWRDWPGVDDWARGCLPVVLARHLDDLASRPSNIIATLEHLRAFDTDDAVRRAVLQALPEARPRLSASGWHNIAVLLARLSPPDEATKALRGLFGGRAGVANRTVPTTAPDPTGGPVPMLLWSAFGHPRRAMRWRAAHATRDLLLELAPQLAANLAIALMACLDRDDAGGFRDPILHFYPMSAAAGLLVALQRVASARPSLLAAHLSNLAGRAVDRDFPHAQIRELARQAALTIVEPSSPLAETLRFANQPAACSVDRSFQHRGDDRRNSPGARYDFDPMDTLPYWYALLARVFALPVDDVAQGAERWILDEWGLTEQDWWSDRRELRDQRSYERMSHRNGSIPPEESLRLCLEYHAMMLAAGELVDAPQPMHFDGYHDTDDPWRQWLNGYLPRFTDTWLADLGGPIPAEAELFGRLATIEKWETPRDDEYDAALHLADGHLPDRVLVAGHTSLNRSGAYGRTHIASALVAPLYAADLQRALAAAGNPTDWKLPEEDETQFEVNSGAFSLHGWLIDRRDGRDDLDEHDPYANGLSAQLPMPGRLFRLTTGAIPDSTGFVLRSADGTVVAHGEQWADPANDRDRFEVTSSGNRLWVARAPLLHFLAETGTTLIVEVQIGRNRDSTSQRPYRPPRSCIYLIDAAGEISVR